MITADSLDYQVLARAVEKTAHLDGLICEIGTRAGGSLKLIIDTVLRQDRMRSIISIDPYGWIDYPEGEKIVKHDYTNIMRDICLTDIFGYLSKFADPPNVVLLVLEDTEFFSRYSDGVPLYNKGSKKIYNDYSLVFLDGPHSVGAVADEIEFFSPKMQLGAVFVCDDINLYDHDAVEQILYNWNFTLVEKTARKASYIKNPL